MSRTAVEIGRPVRSSRAECDHVALVARRGPRETISQVLRREELDFTTFVDVETLRGQISSECSPSLIILWVENTVSGLAGCIEPLTCRFARTPLLVVCPSIERWGVRTALMSGAAGVVLAEDLDSALGPCLRAAQAGQLCVPREHRRQIEPPVLSTREKQILGLVVMGYMNGQIAQQLFLAESTVKSHLSSAFGKLGVRSRNEAVNMILDPERGFGMGILALGGEPVQPISTVAQ
jgi:DNA-binding NarL/FixJ family response regulator